ncbi:MAG TPA: hypothetical protein VNU01_11195, partial [Egibacteraceae bacterium]|nr:hypothetical protein [Egibacteraceae bacterium]
VPVDRTVAALAGRAAVDLAQDAAAESGLMVALRDGAGAWRAEGIPLERVRGERTLPPALQADPRPLAAWLS